MARSSARPARTSAKPSGSDGRMAPQRPTLSAAPTIVLILLVVTIFGSSCDRSDGEPSESPGRPTRSTSGSPSNETGSDLDVQIHRLASETELLGLLREVGWAEAVVLPGGDPIRLELWSGDGHWHAQTTYRWSGHRVEVTQAASGGLPPGRLVEVRSADGIRAGGGLYWLERGFTLAISPDRRSIAQELEWREVR
jgi:hypothetical protein